VRTLRDAVLVGLVGLGAGTGTDFDQALARVGANLGTILSAIRAHHRRDLVVLTYRGGVAVTAKPSGGRRCHSHVVETATS
jgi:hypothetical protein